MKAQYLHTGAETFQVAQVVSTGSQDLYTRDVFVHTLFIVHQGEAGNVKVSVYDRQNTPIALVQPTILGPGSSISMVDRDGQPMEGGMTITADGEGLHLRVKGYFP